LPGPPFPTKVIQTNAKDAGAATARNWRAWDSGILVAALVYATCLLFPWLAGAVSLGVAGAPTTVFGWRYLSGMPVVVAAAALLPLLSPRPLVRRLPSVLVLPLAAYVEWNLRGLLFRVDAVYPAFYVALLGLCICAASGLCGIVDAVLRRPRKAEAPAPPLQTDR
jgi:GAF domain-containing protein